MVHSNQMRIGATSKDSAMIPTVPFYLTLYFADSVIYGDLTSLFSSHQQSWQENCHRFIIDLILI